MKEYIVDASFILKSLLPGDEVAANRFKSIFAEATEANADIIAPKFLIIEIANALRFSIKDIQEAFSIFEDFLGLPINFFDIPSGDYRSIIKLSHTFSTTVYDTSYHFLAKLREGIFLTCDENYYKKAKNLGNIEFIE